MLIDEIIIDENNMGYIPSLGISYQLNDMAKRIIEFIKEGKSKEEIVHLIAKESGTDWRVVHIDVEDFFQKIKIYGLLS